MYKLLTAITLIMFGSFAYAEPLETISTTDSTVTTNGNQTIKTTPPSAIAPSINTANSDLCTVGVAGAVQTQILGISAGTTFTEKNCVRLKNAKTLYDMGMKVAAVSTMCQDPQVFAAMMDAGTPCPYEGMIGNEAKQAWENDAERMIERDKVKKGFSFDEIDEDKKSTILGGGAVGALLLLLLL